MKKLLIIVGLFTLALAVQSANFAFGAADRCRLAYDMYTIYTRDGKAKTVTPKRTAEQTTAVALLTRLTTPAVMSETVRFTGDAADIATLCANLKVKVVWTEQIAGSSITYGYSALLRNAQTINGHKINFMCSQNGDIITVGTPLIAGDC